MRRLVPLLLALCLAACGETQRSDGPARTPSADVDVAALGDSITAGSPLWDPDPAVREQIGAALDEQSQFEAHVPGVTFRNCGVWGERTDEIAARLEECARGAKTLLVQGGINDIVQGRPVSEAASDLRAMVRAGNEKGLRVAIAEVLPWNNGGPPAEPAIAELNAAIGRIAREEKAILLPFHDVLNTTTRQVSWPTGSPTTATIRPSRATGAWAKSSPRRSEIVPRCPV